MGAYQIDPLADPRWQRLSQKHPDARVFHSPSWLKALRDAYGYQPLALTTTPPGSELFNGIVFCRVRSWLTGTRLVSLPFSDHCQPLLESENDLDLMLTCLTADSLPARPGYIEIRPIASGLPSSAGFTKCSDFRLHRLDITPSTGALFSRFHKNIQRNIRRAETSRLRCEKGTSESLLQHFFQLLTLTRQRHFAPPQPLHWFRSLLGCMGDRANIRVAYKDGVPIAGILTLRHNGVLTYKYGCFDLRYRQFGAMSYLLWLCIQEAHQEGMHELDLGRTDPGNAGLIAFKQRWGTVESTLTYWSRGTRRFDGAASQWAAQCLRQTLPHLPLSVARAAGSLLYRHVA